MPRLKTNPTLVPPPPVPPIVRVGAASQEPWREPTRSAYSLSFLQGVLLEMRRVTWPVMRDVCWMSVTIIVLVCGFALYTSSLNIVVSAIFKALGL